MTPAELESVSAFTLQTPQEWEMGRMLARLRRNDFACGRDWFEVVPRYWQGGLPHASFPITLPRFAEAPIALLPTVPATPTHAAKEEEEDKDDTAVIMQRNGKLSTKDETENEYEMLSDLSPTEEAIFLCLKNAGRPLKSSVIGVQAKVKVNSHFYDRLKGMIQKGIITPVDGNRYCLAPRKPQP